MFCREDGKLTTERTQGPLDQAAGHRQKEVHRDSVHATVDLRWSALQRGKVAAAWYKAERIHLTAQCRFW